MQCTGKVLEKKGEIATVRIESKKCDDCQACGFGTVRSRNIVEVNALNRIGAVKDDLVHLDVSGKKVVSASAILFMIPFAGFITGFLLGYFAIGPLFGISKALSGVVLGFILLGVSYYPVYVLENRSEFEFVIREVAPPGEALTPYEPER